VLILGSIAFFIAASLAAVKSVKDPEEPQVPAKNNVLSRYLSRSSQLLIATAVKKVQSHMSVYAAVGRLALSASQKTESAVIQTVQEFAAQLSLRSVSFVTCLFPDFNVVSQLQALLFIVPVLLAADIALVRLLRKQWAVFSVVSSICVLLYDTCINMALLLVPVDSFVFYDAAQLTVNRTFAKPVESATVLSLDRSVTYSAEVQTWRTAAITLLALFGIGLPVSICAFIKHMVDAGRRAEAEERFAFLVSTYRQKRWYWEQVIVLRKLALAAVVVGLRPYPVAQAQGVLVVLMVYLVAMEWQAPFATRPMHNAERATCVGAVIIANTVLGTVSSSLKSSSPTSAVTEVATNSSLDAVNAVIQHLALAVLLIFLGLEWRGRGEQSETSGATSVASEEPSDEELVLALVPDVASGGRNRTFSLRRVQSFSPCREQSQDRFSSDDL
jgi:hypothetical protein